MYGNVIGLDTDGYKSIIQVEWENGTITKGPRLQLEYQPDWKPSNCRQDRKGEGQKMKIVTIVFVETYSLMPLLIYSVVCIIRMKTTLNDSDF